MRNQRHKVVASAVTATIALISLHSAAPAQNSTASFFAGKQIKLITHVGPASGAVMDQMIAELKAVPKDIVATVARLTGNAGGN